MKNGILIAVAGKTDPIRGNHDGPILHIVRHYDPKKVYLILSDEIGKLEEEYNYNKEAIHLLKPDCEVIYMMTGITDVHSYDDFSLPLLKICNQIKEEHKGERIYLDITSGTPQMETALCMIAISDPASYIPIQVDSPERSANKTPFFNPQNDLIEEWFETNLDNEEGTPIRCHVPGLMNFRRPIIQFQILSLIENYDYAGAYQLYLDNKENFSNEVGLLLEHAKKRLNLENKEAMALATELGLKNELYLNARSNVAQLVDFYLSMKIKQFRGELNDLVLRVEIMNVYTATYILEDCMKISIESICDVRKLKHSVKHMLSQEKCEKVLPGISPYMDEYFSLMRMGRFEWGRDISALNLNALASYAGKKPEFQKYVAAINEMTDWVPLSTFVRNPAAHSIIAITEKHFKEHYQGRSSEELCNRMRTVLIQIFGSEVKKESFDIYDKINRLIKGMLEE